MATTPEAKVKAKIKTILKEHNVYYAMPIGSGYGNAGVPDFLCCLQGQFVAVEAKAGKGKTTALQDKNLRDIKASGGYAWVVNEENLEEFKQWVKEYRK
jgi:hypothetical protein